MLEDDVWHLLCGSISATMDIACQSELRRQLECHVPMSFPLASTGDVQLETTSRWLSCHVVKSSQGQSSCRYISPVHKKIVSCCSALPSLTTLIGDRPMPEHSVFRSPDVILPRCRQTVHIVQCISSGKWRKSHNRSETML